MSRKKPIELPTIEELEAEIMYILETAVNRFGTR